MKSKYPLKKHTNIKGELRIKTCIEIANMDGLPSAKEYCIKNLRLSESSWEKTYKPRVMQALKDQTSKLHYPQFVRASEV